MAHTLSAKKRIRQSAKRRLKNRDRKRVIRVGLKKAQAVVVGGDKAASAEELKKAQVVLDRMSSRGAIHKNTAARRKSKLAKKVNKLAAK